MDYPKSVPNVGLVDGKFIDENTVTGAVGSLIPSVWGNTVTDELLAVIKAAGIVPSETASDQLLKAIRSNSLHLTPPRFDVSRAAATTEFVQRSLGNMSGYAQYAAPSGTITAADAGKYIGFNSGGAQAYALPEAATLPQGTVFRIEAVGPASVLTLTAPNTTFTGPNAQAPSASYVLRDSACDFIVLDGGAYRVLGGSGKSSITVNGYSRLPNGLIEQWGSLSVSGTASVTLPIAFPNQCLSVVASGQTGVDNLAGGSCWVEVGVLSLSQLFLKTISSSSSGNYLGARGVYWRAIGR